MKAPGLPAGGAPSRRRSNPEVPRPPNQRRALGPSRFGIRIARDRPGLIRSETEPGRRLETVPTTFGARRPECTTVSAVDHEIPVGLQHQR